MKKYILTTSLLIGLITFVNAQDSYFKFGIGYGLPSGSQMLASESNSKSSFNQNTWQYSYSGSEKSKKGSFGAGTNLTASFGQLLGTYVGYDIELNYLFGKKYEGYDHSSFDGSVYNIDYKGYSRSLTLAPSVFVLVGDHKLKPRIRAGMVLGKNRVFAETSSNGGGEKRTEKMELNGGLSLGFRGGIGIDFNAAKNTSFYAEIVFTGMSYYPKHGEMTENKVNGVDQLNQLPKAIKEVNFMKERSWSSSSPSDENQPSEEVGDSLPFGSIGVQFGVRIRIGKVE